MAEKNITQPPLQPEYTLPLGIDEIMRLLPHRYPMLMVDRVVSYDPDEGIVAYKNITINEPFFNGHFPGNPVMPGIMIVEAMAQTAIISWCISHPESEWKSKAVYFASVEKARFRRPAVAGDRLELRVKLGRNFGGKLYHFSGWAYIDGALAAEATCSAAVVPLPLESS